MTMLLMRSFCILTLSALMFIQCKQVDKHDENDQTTNINLSLYQTDEGWAFDLLKLDKIIISQKHIPAVNGMQFFKTQREAERVALLMKKKLDQNIFPPSISIGELDSLNIRYIKN